MSEHFVIGTVRGSFIHELSSLSETIMTQILNLQLRVPMIHEKSVIEEAPAEADDKYNKIIDLSRPSDYRMKAIEAKHSGVGVRSDDASRLSGTSRMSTVGTVTSVESAPYEGENLSPPSGEIKVPTQQMSCMRGRQYKSLRTNWLIFLPIAPNVFPIEPAPPCHDDKWNQLYKKAEQDAEKERAMTQNVPVKKSSTIEILQNNLDKFQHTIKWWVCVCGQMGTHRPRVSNSDIRVSLKFAFCLFEIPIEALGILIHWISSSRSTLNRSPRRSSLISCSEIDFRFSGMLYLKHHGVISDWIFIRRPSGRGAKEWVERFPLSDCMTQPK